MRTVMLTGATGFIGSHIAERLIRGNVRLHLWGRRKNGLVASLEKEGAKVFVGSPDDLATLRESLQGADAVIHCAGATKALNESGYFHANVDLTRRILGLIQTPQRLVFVSSQAAAGPSSPDIPLDENDEPRPISDYGRSKLSAENYVSQWGAANGNNYVILRPSVVYGPGEKDLYNYFKWVGRGLLPVIGDGRQRISIVHVEDLVNAILAAAEQSSAGGVYFASNDRGYSIREIGHAIRRSLGKTRLIELKLPEFGLDFVAVLLDAVSTVTGRPALLSRQKMLEIKQPAWLCDNAKIRRELGWEPHIPLDIGMKETADWYIEQRWL